MARIVSFIVLVAVLLLIGILFYQVMIPFLLPLFLAVLLVVIFQPLFDWMVARCKGRQRLAAFLTTVAIIVIVVLPIGLILSQAVVEGISLYQKAKLVPIENGAVVEPPQRGKGHAELMFDLDDVAEKIVKFASYFGLRLSREELAVGIRYRAEELLAPLAVNAAKISGKLIIGTIITIIALYYFLADGRAMLLQLMALSPLDQHYEEQLVDEFTKMSRAVVLATLLSAAAQGLLAGIGYFFVGAKPLFLLTLLTMLLAMVPFVGAGSVWVSVCLWLFFIADRPLAAVILALYGATIVSTIDNVIKPMVLHGRSNLHPLLALLSVLGGLRALGPIGIFVGPMAVTFLYALLKMFHHEVERMSQPSLREP